MPTKVLAFGLTLLVLLFAGCRSAPVYDVVAAPVATTKPVSMANVESAIVGAGNGLGWRMTPQAPGRIEGVLTLRDHRAVIAVDYDTKSYSIRYKDSTNLNYDGSAIHKNYNGWIENLDRSIRSNLAAI